MALLPPLGRTGAVFFKSPGMKTLSLCALILALLSPSVHAIDVPIDTKSFEYMFPRGIPGKDWFSKGAYDGHQIKVITDGKAVLQERLKVISSATRSILLSTYIFDAADSSSSAIANALCKKAKQKVDVRLLLDARGSGDFVKAKGAWLRKCGAGILLFSPGKWDLLKIVKAMHEKLLIVDGATVMAGGNGIQNGYHHVAPAHHYFYDFELKIDGPVACWWHFKFMDNYNKARIHDLPKNASIKLDESLYGPRRAPPCYPFRMGKSNVHPVYGNPFFNGKSKTPIQQSYMNALAALPQGARVKLYAPYFVPTEELIAAFIKARKEKNVQISIITNSLETNDEGWPALLGMTKTIGPLLDAGVDVRVWPGKITMHRKAGVYGGKWAYVGSDNLDRRAQYDNTEDVNFSDDPEFIKAIETKFDEDYQKTLPMDHEYLEMIRDNHSWIHRRITPVIIDHI